MYICIYVYIYIYIYITEFDNPRRLGCAVLGRGPCALLRDLGLIATIMCSYAIITQR